MTIGQHSSSGRFLTPRRCYLLTCVIGITLLASSTGRQPQAPTSGLRSLQAADTVRIVVLGSSTAEGVGPLSPRAAWVVRYREYLQSLFPANEVINLASGGYNTYRVMPSDFVSGPDRPNPDPNRNITKAVSLRPLVSP